MSYRFFVDKFDVIRHGLSNEKTKLKRIFGGEGLIGTEISFDSSSEKNFFTLILCGTDDENIRNID